MMTWKKMMSKGTTEDLCRQIAEVRAKNPPKPAAPKKSERELRAAELAELFMERSSMLRRALPWITQPDLVSNLDNYEVQRGNKDQATALAIAKRFASRFMDRYLDQRNSQVGICFLGFPGTGKSHLAKGILLDMSCDYMPGFYIPASEYFDLYLPANAGKLELPLWKIRQLMAGVSCLVLDDVGTGAWTDSRKDRIQQILDLRAEKRLPTIITTNLSQTDFEEEGIERITSRVNQLLYPVTCTWDDYRERTAVSKKTFEEVF